MKKLLLLPVLFFITSLHAQIAHRADSSATVLIQSLPESRAKHLSNYQHLLDSIGTTKRLDSLQYQYVAVSFETFRRHINITEYYYSQPDSFPVLAFENGIQVFDTLDLPRDSFASWQKPFEQHKAIERRGYRFIQIFNFGCVKFPRRTMRNLLRNAIRNYHVITLVDKPSGAVRSRLIVPPRHPLYIIIAIGHGF